jgi:pimeloyl-[acyl-carrier protein] methyl ester esterase
MLHTESVGSGPALVLWHGWGMNLRVFDTLRDAFRNDYHVTSVDLPGHGRSAWPPDAVAETLLTAPLEALPDDAIIVSWSLGAQLAMRAARSAPARVRALILINPTPRFLRSDDWPHGIDASVMQKFAAGLQQSLPQTLTDFFELQLRGSKPDVAALRKLREAVAAQGQAQPAALTAGLQLLAAHDLRTLAPSIVQPALLISGQHDRVTPATAAHALAALLPQARHLEIARAAHLPFLSHPALTFAAIREFLRDLSGAVA